MAPAVGEVRYQEVAGPAVDATARRLAALVCTLVSGELGLGAVEVRWLRPEGATVAPGPQERFWATPELHGCVRGGYPGTIFLVARPADGALVRTVAHECRHLWQAQRHGDWFGWWRTRRSAEAEADQEADALTYATQYARGLGW